MLATLPIRFTSRCAISALYFLARNITTCIIALRDRFDSSVDVQYLLCISWPEKSQQASSHIDRFDSPVDVRYLLLYFLAINHNPSNGCVQKLTPCLLTFVFEIFGGHTSVLDGLCLISQHASSHIDRLDSPVDVRYLVL